jgi:hypothetical protein
LRQVDHPFEKHVELNRQLQRSRAEAVLAERLQMLEGKVCSGLTLWTPVTFA